MKTQPHDVTRGRISELAGKTRYLIAVLLPCLTDAIAYHTRASVPQTGSPAPLVWRAVQRVRIGNFRGLVSLGSLFGLSFSALIVKLGSPTSEGESADNTCGRKNRHWHW